MRGSMERGVDFGFRCLYPMKATMTSSKTRNLITRSMRQQEVSPPESRQGTWNPHPIPCWRSLATHSLDLANCHGRCEADRLAS